MSATFADVFRVALGSAPADFIKGGELSNEDINAVRDAYASWIASGVEDFSHPADEIWPLISHHTAGGRNTLRNLINERSNGDSFQLSSLSVNILKMHLAAFDTVVIADPLRRVFFDENGHERRATSDEIHRVAARVGQLEYLMDAAVVRVSKVHPQLDSRERDVFIAPFGLGSNLRTLTNLIEWGYFPSGDPWDRASFNEAAYTLLQTFGVVDVLPSSVRPLAAIEMFARALMEVTWQLAAVSATGADLYLTTSLERRLLDFLLNHLGESLSGVEAVSRANEDDGRHVELLANVGIPALDVARVHEKDLLEMRAGSAFSEWRSSMNQALGNYLRSSDDLGTAYKVSAFRREMRSAANDFRGHSRAERGKGWWLGDVPVSVTIASASAGAGAAWGGGIMATAATTGVGALAAILYPYFTANRRNKDRTAAVRFLAAFNTNPSATD